MPRSGDNYDYPAGTLGISGQTIFSARYNAWVEDIKATLNLPLPVSKGGTGASNISGTGGARDNLNVPAIEQKITNWSLMEVSGLPAEQGFVWSDTTSGAGAPVDGHAFAGTYFWGDVPTPPAGPQNAVVILQDLDPSAVVGITYIKQKKGGGAWSAWQVQGSGQFVLKAGDTMSGNLTINKNQPVLSLNGTTVTGGAFIDANLNGVARWRMFFMNGAAESGSNAGSDFAIARYNDAGTLISAPLSITRSTGTVNITNQLIVGDHVYSQVGGGGTGAYQFGNTGTKYLNYDGTYFNLVGGALVCSNSGYFTGSVISQSTATSGAFYFGNTGTKHLNYDGTNFNLVGGAFLVSSGAITSGSNGGLARLDLSGGTAANEGAAIYMNKGGATKWIFGTNSNIAGGTTDDLALFSSGVGFAITVTKANNNVLFGGQCSLGIGFTSRAGTAGGFGGTIHNFQWIGNLHAWADNFDIGQVAFVCDYRAKRDVEPIPSTWQQVKTLNPVTYRYRDYGETKDAEGNTVPLFRESDDLQWGFLAHELQETLLPTAATGKKDEENVVQSPNFLAIIAALTKALQEAMTRIEALEELVGAR